MCSPHLGVSTHGGSHLVETYKNNFMPDSSCILLCGYKNLATLAHQEPTRLAFLGRAILRPKDRAKDRPASRTHTQAHIHSQKLTDKSIEHKYLPIDPQNTTSSRMICAIVGVGLCHIFCNQGWRHPEF